MQTAVSSIAPPSPRSLEDLPEALQHQFICGLAPDAAAWLGCTNRAWRTRTSRHPLLAPPEGSETAQQRVATLIRANQPAALSRFLIRYHAYERDEILNERDAEGLTPLMLMATLSRPEGGGINLACVLIGLGARVNGRRGLCRRAYIVAGCTLDQNRGFVARDYAAMAGNIKLASWLEQAGALPPLGCRPTLASAIRLATPHLVRVASHPRDLPFSLMAEVFCTELLYPHPAQQIVATWRLLLDTFPQWHSSRVSSEEASSLVRHTFRHSSHMPLVKFLHQQGILARAALGSDVFRMALMECRTKEDTLCYLIRETGIATASGLVADAIDLRSGYNVIACLLENGHDAEALDITGKSLLQKAIARCDKPLFAQQQHGAAFSEADAFLTALVHTVVEQGASPRGIAMRGWALELAQTLPCNKASIQEALKVFKKRGTRAANRPLEDALKTRLAAGRR